MSGGAPVEGQIAVLIPRADGGEERFTCRTTRNGRFYIDELPAGALTLEGRGEGGETATIEVETAAGAISQVEIETQGEGAE